jgi:metal-responsive CopG/Arc/MetJ family transcriptional regulator
MDKAMDTRMKTIQMTIDEELLQAVDAAVDHFGTSRSAFEALQQALRQMIRIATLERHHVAGYEQYPVKPGKFDVWQDEQVWEEAL